MTMNKLELWRKGDKLTANKLNDALVTLNQLIDAENDRMNEAANDTSATLGVQYNSVSLVDNVPSWYQEITPLWDQDGETVIYDEWDYNGSALSAAGLYGRDVGVNAITTTNYTEGELHYIISECEVKSGQQVVQEITIDDQGEITCNKIIVVDSVAEIPQTEINPNGTTTLYRRLSRVVDDVTHVGVGSDGSSAVATAPSAAWLYKSVATNDLTLSPITVNAIGCLSQSSSSGSGSSSGDDQQLVQLVVPKGVFSKVKNIENLGGLSFADSECKLGISSGVEFYSYALPCASGTPDFGEVNNCLAPKPAQVTIAEFPISYKHYEWDKDNKDYKEAEKSGGEPECEAKLRIIAQPICCRAWQWGFTYEGEIEVESYKYSPCDNLLMCGSEGILVEGNSDEGYKLSRDMYLETMSAEGKDAPNGIEITCSKDGSRITYSLYAPASGKVCGGEGISVGGDAANGYQVSRNLYIEMMPSGDSAPDCYPNAITVRCSEDKGRVTYSLYAPDRRYEFDTTYFCVSYNSISLNRAALCQLVNEVVCELAVEVTASGAIDSTFAGTVKANTSGSLTIATNVSY